MRTTLKAVQSVYHSFSIGNIPAVLAVMAPDIRWTEAEGGPYGGVFIGPDAVLENVFMKLGGEWDGYAAVPTEFLSQGETVVVLGNYSGVYKKTGKGFSAPYVHVWRFRGGLAVEFQQYTDTAVHLRPMS